MSSHPHHTCEIRPRRLLNLLGQSLIGRAERGDLIWDHRRGISLGCPLSPLLGAAFLTGLDAQLARRGVWYRRDVDDVLVIASTRWHLRRAIRLVKQGLAALGLEAAPGLKRIVRGRRNGALSSWGMDSVGRASTVARASETDQAKVEVKAEWRVWIPLTSASTLIFDWWRWAAGGLPDLQPCLTPLPPSIAQQNQ